MSATTVGSKPLTKGVYTALVTPFRAGAIDEAALNQLIAHQIACGVKGLVVAGTTGEAPALTDAEHAQLCRLSVEASGGRCTVIAGVGSPSTAHASELAQQAAQAGVDALMVTVPYYVRPSLEGIRLHLRALADAAALPQMLYNVPRRTGRDVRPEELAQLADDQPLLQAVKEASGSAERIQVVVDRLGERLQCFCGDDALALPAYACGAAGLVSVSSNVVPREVCAVFEACGRVDLPVAQRLQRALQPLHAALFAEASPGPVKWLSAALAEAQRLPVTMQAELRLPMTLPTPALREELLRIVDSCGLCPPSPARAHA